MNSPAKILAVDDKPEYLHALLKVLRLKKYCADVESDSLKVLDLIEKKNYDIFLLDVNMPRLNGTELFEIIRNRFPDCPVIMISGESTIGTAVEMIKKGAYDFIEKPVDPERLYITIEKALEKSRIFEEMQNLRGKPSTIQKIIGESGVIKKLHTDIKQLAPTNAKVLITGESGTGKELVAAATHYHSKRTHKPYITINCSAIPGELLESELFGHKKGSFTGATSDKKGKFLAADGGSIFLDEIGDMDLRLQAKMLRVLEENEIEVIGENESVKVDVRIISATNKNLAEMVQEGTFREDLFHRLNTIQLRLPALRERKADIITLAKYFLEKFSVEYKKDNLEFDIGAELLLCDYDYPGNVRELKNLIERVVIFADGRLITQIDVERAYGKNNFKAILDIAPDEHNLKNAKAEFEKIFIERALKKNEWNLQNTANELGLDRSNLFKKMKQFGLNK